MLMLMRSENSIRQRNRLVFLLLLMLMSRVFSLAYAYAYALVRTSLYWFLVFFVIISLEIMIDLKIHYSISYCTIKFSYVFPITGDCSFDFHFWFSPVKKSKLITIQWINSRIWDMIMMIDNKQPHQESGLCCFSSTRYFQSVSLRFIELCMETPCLCPSEGHKHGGRKVKETSVTEFCY